MVQGIWGYYGTKSLCQHWLSLIFNHENKSRPKIKLLHITNIFITMKICLRINLIKNSTVAFSKLVLFNASLYLLVYFLFSWYLVQCLCYGGCKVISFLFSSSYFMELSFKEANLAGGSYDQCCESVSFCLSRWSCFRYLNIKIIHIFLFLLSYCLNWISYKYYLFS